MRTIFRALTIPYNFYIFCWPFLLSPLIATVRALQRRRLQSKADVELVSDLDVPSAPINWLLYQIAQFERRCNFGFWGSSLFMVLRKEEH